MFFRLLIIALISFATSAAFAGKEYAIPLDEKAEIVVSGKISVGRILFLTGAQYTQYFYENKLSPLDIVVIDQLPTELDPFPLAGVITEAPVQRGCHMERQATKIQIPLLTLEGAMNNSVLRDLSKTKGVLSFEVDLTKRILKIKTDIPDKVAEKIFQSRLKPISISEYPESYNVIQPLRDVPWEYLEHYGQKLISIGRASLGQTQGNFPNIIGVPADIGTQLERGTTIHVNGEFLTIEEAIHKQMKKIGNLNLFSDEVPKLLSEIQSWLDQIPYHHDIFDRLMLMIDTQFRAQGGIGASLRFRSSNRVEDKIGAGAYRSVHLNYNEWTPRAARTQQIFKAYIDVLKSLYTPRAYMLRRMFSLDESLTDIACGIHVSEDAVKASGVASIESVNAYKILKIVSHPSGGSGTSPLAGSYYETIYLIQNPSGEIRFSSDGLISNKTPFEPNLTTLTKNEALTLFREAEASKESWNRYGSYDQSILLEWGMKETGEPRLFDVKELNNNLAEAPPAPPEFGLNPESNEILGQLGFQTFETALQTRAFGGNGNFNKKVEIAYVYVQIEHQSVFVALDGKTSADAALELISDSFKQYDVKFLSSGTIKAGIKNFHGSEDILEFTSMDVGEKNASAAFNEIDARNFLFSLFKSNQFRAGYADFTVSPPRSLVNKYAKRITKDYFERGGETIRIAWISKRIKNAVYGNIPPVQTIPPFSNIAPDVASIFKQLGLRDVHEGLMEEAAERPFAIGKAMNWHILLTVDGVPKIVTFKHDQFRDHSNIINILESRIEALSQKHDIRFLQFGNFNTEITYPGKILSLDIHSSIYSRARFDFKMIKLWLEAIRSTGVEFAADAHFLDSFDSDFRHALETVFKNRKWTTIPFNEILDYCNITLDGN